MLVKLGSACMKASMQKSALASLIPSLSSISISPSSSAPVAFSSSFHSLVSPSSSPSLLQQQQRYYHIASPKPKMVSLNSIKDNKGAKKKVSVKSGQLNTCTSMRNFNYVLLP